MKKPERPNRKWNNFEEFAFYQRTTWRFYSQDIKGIKWPCLECSGKGRMYDPDDPPCPIEGNKCRRIITCPVCKGTREGSRWEWVSWYKRENIQYNKELAKFKAEYSIYSSIMKKLNKKEKDYLGL